MFDIAQLENLMYEVGNLFLVPVLLTLAVLFFYAFFTLGGLAAQARQRVVGKERFSAEVEQRIAAENEKPNTGELNIDVTKGYPLFSRFCSDPGCTLEDLEIFAIKQLEGQRIVTRVAPMLGLIATMIPMGPALKALADGNVQGISENLIVAFSAVIFGLIIASITFCTASIRKQWLVSEIRKVQEIVNAQTVPRSIGSKQALSIDDVLHPEEGHEAA
ncbi:MAG: MotA/TolQ/ExbB proton channel family protein [Gammaproteobacteria bacterium]